MHPCWHTRWALPAWQQQQQQLAAQGPGLGQQGQVVVVLAAELTAGQMPVLLLLAVTCVQCYRCGD
jgi:hypothetical protein